MAEVQMPCQKVLAHIDLDAFYAQVEALRDPARLAGKPSGVVQYNPYGDLKTLAPDDDRLLNNSNGSLIAVSYEARAAGVKRNMRGDAARALCPDLQLVQVPTAHGKADLTLYRDAGKRVLDILARKATCERASIDECYLDLTNEAQKLLVECCGAPPLPMNVEQVHVMGEGGALDADTWWQRPAGARWENGDVLLACGAAVIAELRDAVKQELGFTCSAGIAHTKLLAKLASGLHKPAQQTVVPAAAVPGLLGPLPISKLRQLGGKFGARVAQELMVQTVGELAAVPQATLQQLFGEKDESWLYALARGVDDGEVTERTLPKSLSCGKTFRGNHALVEVDSVHRWLLELAGELEERLATDQQANHRSATLLTVSFAAAPPWAGSDGVWQSSKSLSRSCQLRRPQAAPMAEDATALIRRWAKEHGLGWSIGSLFLAASNFQPTAGPGVSITKFFRVAPATAEESAMQASRPTSPALMAMPPADESAQLEQPGRCGEHSGQPPAAARSVYGQGTVDNTNRGEQLVAGPNSGPVPAAPSLTKHQQVLLPPNEACCADRAAADTVTVSPKGGQGPVAASGNAAEQAGARHWPALGDSAGQKAGNEPGEGAGSGVDPDVLAELPPSIQREIRAQLKAQQMTERLKEKKRKPLASQPPAGALQQRQGQTQGRTGSSSTAKRQRSGAGGIGSFYKPS
ncbi:hypothetical protein N2152v2_002700 [Parachlorella kessleri]